MGVITFPENLLTTSGDLFILLHDVISLPDATSYDNFLSISVNICCGTQKNCLIDSSFG